MRRYLKTLLSGKFGLARTYWIHGVLGWLAGFMIMSQLWSVGPMFWAIAAIWGVYALLMVSAVWGAAHRFPGCKGWSALAKFSACLAVAMVPVLTFLSSVYIQYYSRFGWP